MKSKHFVRGIIVLAILYAIGIGIARQVQVGRLAQQLRAGSPEQRVTAADTLMKRDRLYDKVQQMDPEERIAAAGAVKAVGGERAVKQLLVLLKDGDVKVKESVTAHLTELGGEHIELLVPALKDSDTNVNTGAANALVGIGPKVIPHVQAAAKDSTLRAQAIGVLVRVGGPSVTAVVELLSEDDQDLRMAAADALGKIGSREATPALLEAARDIAAVRRVAISSLCTITDPRSTDLLVDVLGRTDDDGEVRARAARALSVIGGGKAMSALVGALGDLDLKVRTSVITGLQRIGDPAVEPVMVAIGGGSEDVRHAGAAVMEKIESASAASALLRLAGSADPIVRLSAARGLGQQRSNPQIGALIGLLADSDGRVADSAVQSLANLESVAVSPLIAVMQSPGQPDTAKYRASNALAKIGPKASSSLRAVAGSQGAGSVWAVYALGQARDSSARDLIRELASAGDAEMKWTAERALQRL